MLTIYKLVYGIVKVMSSGKSVSTKYNPMPLIVGITVIVISVAVSAIALFLAQRISNTQKEVSQYTNYEKLHIDITPKPTRITTPTPRSTTPTPLPTLSDEQKQEIKDTFKKSFEDKGLEIPPEDLKELENLQ